MAAEQLAKVPRALREVFMLGLTVQELVIALGIGSLVQEVTDHLLLSFMVAGVCTVLAHPKRGLELGVRLAVLVRHVVLRRRTVNLGSVVVERAEAPVARVVRKEKGWTFKA